MKKAEYVNSWQMSILFLTFMLGSSIVNIPHPLVIAAKNGAWLSLLLANAMGMLLLFCILYLHRRYPDSTFIDYSRELLGPWITIIISLPFLLVNLVMLTDIVVDIGGFFTTTMMKETPPNVIHFLILLTAAMTVRGGVEAMARMSTLVLYTMLFSVFLILGLASERYHPEYLFPLFPHGLKPFLHGTYVAFGFPYAELIIFSMILPFVRRGTYKRLKKFMFSFFIIHGISLSLVVICSIMALGPWAGLLKFSVFQLARLVEVRDFIERIESAIAMTLIAGSYMKSTIALFALNMGVSQLLKLRDDRLLIFPLALITLLLTLVGFDNEMEFVEHVTIIYPIFITVAGIVPVLLVTMVSVLKTNKMR